MCVGVELIHSDSPTGGDRACRERERSVFPAAALNMDSSRTNNSRRTKINLPAINRSIRENIDRNTSIIEKFWGGFSLFVL